MSQIPRGIEVLLKKASVDPVFRRLLVEKRAQAAREIDLELSAAAAAILAGFPRDQLEKIIDNTRVAPEHRSVFLSRAGTLMLALVAGMALLATTMTTSFGHTVRDMDEILRKTADREAQMLGQAETNPAADANDGSKTDESASSDVNDPDAAIRDP